MAGRPPVLPSSNLSYSENFLYMLDSMGDKSYKPNPRLARVLDILFILHAEHEMNCSTAAARHLASSGLMYTLLLLEPLEHYMGLFMVEPMRYADIQYNLYWQFSFRWTS
ncbi:putative citrate synthase [Helianthus annuus]|nr:putative citrate synthase [Helianthus annuus]